MQKSINFMIYRLAGNRNGAMLLLARKSSPVSESEHGAEYVQY